MKIYHYTSIKNLALILKNRTLHFNCVKNVNDPDECITQDYKNLQKYCFVSCWTKNQDEKIPFWEIYGDRGHGIRLETDTNLIHFEKNDKENDSLNFVIKNIKKEKSNSYFIPLYQNSTSINYYFETNYSDKKRIFEVDYSNNESKQCIYDIEAVFNTKKTCWSFEDEIRFILLGCKLEDGENVSWQSIFNKITDKKKSKINNDFKDCWVDLILKDDFFANLKIICGPKTDEAEKTIIKSLASVFFNKNIQISESVIKMK